MGTSNFHYVNASKVFVVGQDAEEQFEFDDEVNNAIEFFLENGFKVREGTKDENELRSFPSRYLATKISDDVIICFQDEDGDNVEDTFYVGIEVFLRSGYYTAACLDYTIKLYSDNIEISDTDSYDFIFEHVYGYTDLTDKAKEWLQTIAPKLDELKSKMIKETEELFSKICGEDIYVVTARFSNGETWYGKADSKRNILKNALLD